jgi:hypothetical protein
MHKNESDQVVQSEASARSASSLSSGLNVDGIPYPGVGCNCAPPDTDGEAGETQFTQIVNEGFQVFDKTTGASVYGPVGISTLWTGFGGVCEKAGHGDPIVLYDQLANRWVISQFAGTSVPTDECIAVSTSNDASGSYNRYDFHLGSNFFDYPKLAVWPDAYYMSMNVFNAAGTSFLGPQPFAFDRAAMVAGTAATFVTTGITNGPSEDGYLPADLDGKTSPPAGAPNTFVGFPGRGVYALYHFQVDFATPSNSTFTLFAKPAAAGFTELCATTRDCVPQSGTASGLDGIGDRLMFRAAYRNFGDHESLVVNHTVEGGALGGVRWYEIRNPGTTPSVFQQGTIVDPDTDFWLGSIAMDRAGDIAVGFSAMGKREFSSVYVAGRKASDPLGRMSGPLRLVEGSGVQVKSYKRWGDYSSMTVDPKDDCTFWYTQEYYVSTGSFNWATRVGAFKFDGCKASAK